MVLDRVVGAPVKNFGDVSPLVLIVELPMHKKEDPLLFSAPVDLLDPRVQMVVPALATLLAHAARQVLGDAGPALGSVLLN